MTKETEIYSPLTGTVTMQYVEDGELVEKGERILGIECMKTIYDVSAPISGTVKYKVEFGQVVGEEDVLAIILID